MHFLFVNTFFACMIILLMKDSTMSELFSTRAVLALQTAAFIAYHGQDGEPVKSSRIIERYNLNKRALEPILQILSRAGIVESKAGASGGYLIADSQLTTLGDIAALFIDTPSKESLCFSDWESVLLPSLTQAHHAAFTQLRGISLMQIIKDAANAGIQDSDEKPLDFII
jgi:DNA-binding IscR family transcriptional regulator